MRDLDKIKSKILKLINLSEDVNASNGEVANAMNAATRMMAAHNLTRDDIDHSAKSGDPTQRVTMGRHCAVSIGTNLSTWECMLMHFVCDFIGYVAHYKTSLQYLRKDGIAVLDDEGHQRKGCLIYFYGSSDSAEACVELYEELRDTICAMAQLLYGGWYKGDGAVYAQGFCSGLELARQKAIDAYKNSDDQTTALVLQDEKQQAIVIKRGKDWLKKEHGIQLRKGSRRSGASGDAAAFSNGQRDGRNHGAQRPQVRRKLTA